MSQDYADALEKFINDRYSDLADKYFDSHDSERELFEAWCREQFDQREVDIDRDDDL